MRRLIVANTYYQLIFAIQLKITLFKSDEIVLLVSDHSNNADSVSEHIAEMHFFEETYYVHTLGSGDKRTSFQKLEDFIQITFGKLNRYCFYIEKIKDLHFDEILVFNYDISIYGLYSLLANYNKTINVSRFEESILTYNSGVINTTRRNLINKLRKIQGKPSIADALKNFYCFYPVLYSGIFNSVKVPQIKKTKELVSIFQKAFSFEQATISYPEKYIFFTSVYDFEGGQPIGEYDLVCKIAKFVGQENLLIKVHPRDKRTLYADSGFKVDKNSSVPWEAIQLSLDFSNKIFVTATSGSVLAGNLMFENKVKTYYMYKQCNLSENLSAIETVHDIEKLLRNPIMKESLSMVKVAEQMEDILR